MESVVKGSIIAQGQRYDYVAESIIEIFKMFEARCKLNDLCGARIVKITDKRITELYLNPDYVCEDSKDTTFSLITEAGEELVAFNNYSFALKTAHTLKSMESIIIPQKRLFAIRSIKEYDVQEAVNAYGEAIKAQYESDCIQKEKMISDLKAAINVLERADPCVCRWVEARRARHSLKHLTKRAVKLGKVAPKRYVFIDGMSGRVLR